MSAATVQPVDTQRILMLRDEIKFEHTMMSSRLNSFITSQSFLFAAYAVSGIGDHAHHQAILWFAYLVVPSIGILFSLLLLVALNQARKRLFRLNVCLHHRLYDKHGNPSTDLAGDLCIDSLSSRRQSLFYTIGVPIICGLAWSFVGVVSVSWQYMMMMHHMMMK